jgi:hypothetical protein
MTTAGRPVARLMAAALLAVVLAACSASAPPRPAPGPPGPPGPTRATTRAPAGEDCPFLTRAQVARALSQPVVAVRGCAYNFAADTATVGVIASTYTSARAARACLRHQAAGPGARVSRIRDLSPAAETIVRRRDLTVRAVLVRGARSLTVVIFWRQAARNPHVAVILLRDAAAHFDRETAAAQRSC